MPLSAVILNCSLKKSSDDEPSNTAALIDKIVALYGPLGVSCEVVRVADHKIGFGIKADTGEGDEWPSINAKVNAADILIIATPIWMGHLCSLAQLVIERLDGSSGDTDDKGQFPLYNKVSGVIVTGNEDGAHAVAEQVIFNLSHLGATAPPNCDCYWVGEAGPGPSYIKADGDRSNYVNKTARYLAHNTTWFAQLLKDHPIPTDLKALQDEAKKVSAS